MLAKTVLLYLIGLFVLGNASRPNNPIVRPNISTFNTNGSITGTILPGFRTPFIEAFLGVPFAEPPLGDLRFSNPVPFQDFWGHDHVANQEREMCIQINHLSVTGTSPIEGSEDCLYLNVFRPLGTSSDRLLPVMTFVHGGSFTSGSTELDWYGPKFFIDHGDVILITIAYRLGPIGFLSTGDNEMPGNFGFKDQVIAMQWIKENIMFFNGDPNQITIFGQSAGGVSVHFHMFSPLTHNLFNRVGVMSQSAISSFAAVNFDPLRIVRLLAQTIGIENHDTLTTAELTTAFKAIDPRVILIVASFFQGWTSDPFIAFTAVVESNNPNAYLIEDPRVSLINGNYKKVPLLFSVVPEEGVVTSGIVLTNEALLAFFNDNFDAAIALFNGFAQDDPETPRKTEQVIDFYFNGTRNVGWHNGQRLSDMVSDHGFHYPLYSSYKFHSKSVDPLVNPLYLMEFNYRGPFSFSYLFTQSTVNFGVIHSDDLLYLFDNGLFPLFDIDSVEAQLVIEMVNIYVNFAYGRAPHEKSTVCTFDASDPDKPCEFLYIVNSADGNGYEVETSNDTDMDMINFWRGIDKLF